MKVIKKYFKVVMCFMAFALCSFLMVFAPTMTALSVEAAISDYARTINSMKIKVEENKGLIIPLLTGSFASNGYSIKVVDPAGSVRTCKVTSAGDFVNETIDNVVVTRDGNGYFDNTTIPNSILVPEARLTNGNYQVVYVVNEDGKEFYSNIYNVNVERSSYELSFEKENGWKSLVKPEVATSSNVNDRIEIPVPVAKSEDKKGKVTLKNLDPEKEISVSCNGTSLTLNAEGSDFVEVGGKYYIQPSTAGVYKIQYTYKSGANRPTKTISIKVSDGFVEPTDFKVTTAPSFDKFELGETGITLPKLTAKNEYESDVAYNVTSIKIEKESDSNIKQELCSEKSNNYTFDMTLAAFGLTAEIDTYDKLKGNYVITYTLVDAYGKETTYTKRIEGVTASKKPTIKMVYDYTDATVNPESAETELKNKYGYDQIVLPAAYAEDLVSKRDELIVVRYIRNVNTSTIYYVDNLKYNSAENKLENVTHGEIGYNYSGDPNLGQIDKAVEFRFNDGNASSYAGTYQLEYRVIATNIAKRESTLTVSGSSKYTFTVDKLSQSEIKATTPTVEITNVNNNISVDRQDDITVKFTATDDDDTRLKKAVFYYYGDKSTDNLAKVIEENAKLYDEDRTSNVLDNDDLLSDLNDAGYTGITTANLNEDKTGYVVKFAKEGANSTATKAVIIAIAYNDYGKVEVDTRIVNFKYTDETDAPELQDNIVWNDFNSDGKSLKDANKAKIGETVILPDLTYTDADNTLLTNVSYYIQPENDEDGPWNDKTGFDYLSPYKKSYPGMQIVGGRIDIERGGDYVVVYTATDDAGNTSVTYFTFHVESNAKPILTVTPTGEDITISGNTVTAEVGSTIAFDTIVRDGDDKSILDQDVTVVIEEDGLNYSASSDREMAYIFESVGTYTLTFKAADAADKVIYVNITPRKLEWIGNFDVPEHAPKSSKVYLPDIAATDNAIVKVTVTSSTAGASDIAVEKVFNDGYVDGSFWCFETGSSTGRYTVKYTATTADATLEKTFTIIVGDNVPPTIKYNHKAELQKDIVYDGSNQIEIKFDVKKTYNDKYFKIIATSNGKTIYSYDLGLNITDITDGSANASTMSWGDLKYEITGDSSVLKQDTENKDLYLISGKGTFTIKLSIKDGNENETIENIVFKVVDKAEIEEENDTVVGVVLIVISLVVLAGVILYFMLTSKKGKGKKANKVVKQAKAKAEKVEAKKEAKVEEVKTEEVKAEVEETKAEPETEIAEAQETVAEEEKAETPVEETTENNDAKEGEIEE